MTAGIFTALLVAFLPIGFGTWAILVGFGVIGKVAAADQNPRSQAGRRICRFGGPLLIAAGFWIAAQPSIAPGFGLDWQPYAPAGERFSIDLPGGPVEAIAEETGEFGPVENRLARVFLWRLDMTYTVRRTPLPDRFPELSRQQTADWLHELVIKMAAVNQGTIVGNTELERADGVARTFHFELKNDYVCRGEILLLGRTRFELTIVGPSTLANSEIADRFFRSFSYYPAVAAKAGGRAAEPPDAHSEAERE